MISLPKGIPVRQNVNPARINIPEAMEKLRVGSFTGYLRFDAPQGNGIIIFENGKLVSALFSKNGEADRLIAYDAIAKIFEISILGEAVLNIYRLAPDLAMSLHTLLHGKYIYREQDLKVLDVKALLERIKSESLSGCLRVYAEQKTALIFYENGNALGFFHDGTAELKTTADLSASVAKLPEAKIDLLQTGKSDDLVLADLMASADLGPMWQKLRKMLMQDRSQREEAAIRSREEEQDQKRTETLTTLKTISANYIGKFGVSQVEKAFSGLGSELKPEDKQVFYEKMERLATMVAKPKKVTQMIKEMKKKF